MHRAIEYAGGLRLNNGNVGHFAGRRSHRNNSAATSDYGRIATFSTPSRRSPKTRPATGGVPPQRDAPEPGTPPLSAGGTSLLQARTVNEVLKAQLNKVELAHRKKELVDRAQAVAHVFKLARIERDAWLNWPARISGQMASALGVDAHTMHVTLEAAVREHLIELGELRPRVD